MAEALKQAIYHQDASNRAMLQSRCNENLVLATSASEALKAGTGPPEDEARICLHVSVDQRSRVRQGRQPGLCAQTPISQQRDDPFSKTMAMVASLDGNAQTTVQHGLENKAHSEAITNHVSDSLQIFVFSPQFEWRWCRAGLAQSCERHCRARLSCRHCRVFRSR